jgi:hypothetical protein
MLESRCSCAGEEKCLYCKYNLPSLATKRRFSSSFTFPLPEEVFAKNSLKISHASGFQMEVWIPTLSSLLTLSVQCS